MQEVHTAPATSIPSKTISSANRTRCTRIKEGRSNRKGIHEGRQQLSFHSTTLDVLRTSFVTVDNNNDIDASARRSCRGISKDDAVFLTAG